MSSDGPRNAEPPSAPVRQPSGRWHFTRTPWWHALRLVVGLGLAALAASALNGRRGELVDASGELAHLAIPWLLAAILVEIISLVCFAQLQRRLLSTGGVRAPLRYMTAMTLASGAISSSLPAGPAFASVYAFGIYRRRGANETLAAWTLLATFACAAVGLAVLAVAGVTLAASEGASYDLIWVIVGVFVLSIVADAIVFQRRWIENVAIALMRATSRLIGRPRRHARVVVQGWVERLEDVHVKRRDLVVSVLAATGDWVFDCACLAFSFLAVGGSVPWRGLLLAYGVGQLAANLPITPGGLGVVEGSITVALVALGGSELSTLAAVLLYRIVSFWGFLPVGWLSFAALALDRRRSDRRAAVIARDPTSDARTSGKLIGDDVAAASRGLGS